ncbi:MAG: ACT domain-containing protein [Candidatus Burarchaeum sp.]|nr:ACT domain-containing protein [Candidatus Burarchaeum sp.]MDO8339696.1 ACT domain-containing protein [Candidatus Burarchaeum sp.]
MDSLTIIAPDRIGLLLEITDSLGKEHVNIESISLEVIGKKAVVRLMIDTKNIAGVKKIFEKKGFRAVESDTLMVKLNNKPGELSKVAKVLAENGVAVENVHIVDKQGKQTLCAIRVDKPEKAEKLLKEYM